MFKADESRSKIDAVWEGTTVRMFLMVQLLRQLRFHSLYCSLQVAQPPAHPRWQRVLDLLRLIGRKGRRPKTESPRVCTSGLRKDFCGPETEARPELGDHVSWNKQSDCEAMSVPVNWKPCKQTRFCQSNPETATSCFENLETATSRFAAPEVKGPRAVSLKAIVDALF